MSYEPVTSLETVLLDETFTLKAYDLEHFGVLVTASSSGGKELSYSVGERHVSHHPLADTQITYFRS